MRSSEAMVNRNKILISINRPKTHTKISPGDAELLNVALCTKTFILQIRILVAYSNVFYFCRKVVIQ